MAETVDSSLPDDGVLVAYIDGELEADVRAALEARLAADPKLRSRLAHLERGGLAFAEAYAPLVAAAPKDKLDAILANCMKASGAVPSGDVPADGAPAKTPRKLFAFARRAPSDKAATGKAGGDGTQAGKTPKPPKSPSDRRRDWALTAIAAAVALFVAGAATGFIVPLVTGMTEPMKVAERPGWRQVVAEYMALMTPETLSIIPQSPAILADELTAVGQKVSLDLTADKVALPHVYLKRAQLFEFRGMPLAQLAYLSRDDGPMALCIIANGRPDAPAAFEQREGFNIVFWTHDGLGYMLIGKASRNTLEAFAGDLASKVS